MIHASPASLTRLRKLAEPERAAWHVTCVDERMMRWMRGLLLAASLPFTIALGCDGSSDADLGPAGADADGGSTAAPGDDGGAPLEDGAVKSACGTASWPTLAAAATSQTASPSLATDGDRATSWTSATHATAQNAESITITLDAAHPVNRLTLGAAKDATGAVVGFPVEIAVSTFDGNAWQRARGFTHYPTPTTDCVSLDLPDTVQTSQVRVTAKVLGPVNAGSYGFALAELSAGHDASLEPVDVAPVQATASSTVFPASQAYDSDPGTFWSSATHDAAASPETFTFSWPTPQKINAVKLRPRFAVGRPLGFPVAFTLSFAEAGGWTSLASYADFVPTGDEWLVLPLAKDVTTTGIRVDATTLAQDDVANYVFQLAEVGATYDPRFASFRFSGNDGASGRNEIGNVGSESMDRDDQLRHWDYDERDVLLAPSPGGARNIYAPSIVATAPGHWNVYFGGWDGAPTMNDRLYRTSTSDDFATFGGHALILDHGVYEHVNNDSTIQIGPGDWRMIYTTLSGALNKPAYARSTDGLTWGPDTSSFGSRITMTGYPDWANADVNGGNVVYRDAAGTFHLYFIDFHAFPGVYHATSTDFVSYTYVGKISSEAHVVNDWKGFSYGGTSYYVGVYHLNGQTIWMTVGSSLTTAPPRVPIFTNAGDADEYMVAVGLVQDGRRVYGALYGAGAVPSLDENRIFAEWLQKKVVFSNASVRWGDIERAVGPDTIHLLTAEPKSVQTGRFEVYDTDGTTLLYRSPTLTMRAGDVWTYAAGY